MVSSNLTIGDASGTGLVDDTEDIKDGDSTRILGGLMLSIIAV